MKPLINPGNPTPSKFGIGMLNPESGKIVMFDDCQRRSGILFDYKGPTYTALLATSLQPIILGKLIRQATNQVNARDGRHIVWVFEEEDTKDFVKSIFDNIPTLKGKIQFDSEPMPGFSI